MEAGIIAIAVVAVMLATVIGIYIGKKRAERRYANDTNHTQGTLNIDAVDPEFQPGIFLALSTPVDDVMKRRYIILDVNVMKQNSHK